MDSLKKAIELIGGQANTARLLGFKHQSAVSNWLIRGRLPEEHAPAIERGCSGAVRCEDLCPDVIWQRDPQTNAVTGYVVPVAPATDQQEAA